MKYTVLNTGWCGGKNTLWITSPFGFRKKYNRKHNGVDIGIPEGTKIYAPLNGTLEGRFDPHGYGLYLKLTSGNITLIFAHMSKTSVSVGQTRPFTQGQQIGLSGGRVGDPNAGRSTGPHLHFEYRYNGTPIDPKFILGEALQGRVKRNTIKTSSIGTQNTVEVTDAMMRASNQEDIESQTDASATESWDATKYELEEGLAGGIWQIIKLAMDTEVANLRLHDTSISVQTGALSSFFQKVCQQPLVEFSGDTYGDQYYFLVRKPPFDKETMRKTLDTLNLLEDSGLENNPYYIKSIDILNYNISFGNPNIYSWYQMYPIYEMGDANALQYIIPAVFFPEFAAIWGSRELTVRSQYRTFVATDVYDKTVKDEKSKYGDAEARHALDDLRYIVESNAYNAFTRSGTITLTGNRKIKRGTFIRITIDDVDEIFYVESVTHSFQVSSNSVDRTTVLQVSHGMVKRYMFDDVSVKNFNKTPGDYNVYSSDIGSYFNIINFGDYNKLSKEQRLNMDNWREIISSWKVNINVFKFFLRKYQFLV